MKFLIAFLLVSFSLFAGTDTICNTSIYGEYPTTQSKCRFGDVMTGVYSVSPLQLRCGRLAINCMDKSVDDSADTHKQTVQTDGDAAALR